MSRIRRTIFTLVAAAATFAGGASLPVQADTIPPVRRISCPSYQALADIMGWKQSGTKRVERTPTRCTYYAGKQEMADVGLYNFSLAEAKERLENPNNIPYLGPGVKTFPIPELGPEAFWWADAGPANVEWYIEPGQSAEFIGYEWDAPPSRSIKAAKLFRPMMEVYTVPGERTVNGRQWRTTCEAYSATYRCRTDIWATQVTRTGNIYTATTGWFFNSLTYRWSDRSMWSGNPLGKSGSWTATDGRQWRTECDTQTTGRGACRSYTLSSVVSAQRSSSGTRYVTQNKWVFNNQVLFNQ